ncbi:MAG: amino acid permease [Eubacteriales bacterium]|nr:amino acid permease [Eubacteriales bacterium]MDD4389617.1 amino acid permease [Eubacteriales bacterium]
MENEKGLKRNLGAATATAMVVGCVIGAGVFFKPQAIYTLTGGAPGMGMLAWVIGGIVSVAAALTFAEVAILIPKTGGMVAYLGEVYNEKVGFLAGWMQTVIFYPAFMAGYGVVVGQQLALFIGDRYQLPIAMSVIILLVIMNTLGSNVGGSIQIIFTICKLIPLFLLMIFGFVLGSGDNPIFTPMVAEGLNGGAVLGSALLAVLFAFEGWTNVGTIAGEMKNPAKDLPLAIVGGVSIIMAVYFVINIAYLWVLPADEMKDMVAPASAVAMEIFGSVGGLLITIGIIISVFGAANGFLMSGSRVAYLLGVQNTLPGSNSLKKLNRNQVPSNAIILIGFIACIYSISGQFNMLTDLAVFSSWIFYTLTFLCVMKLRKTHPELERKYKVPLYPFIPLLAIISGVYVIISQLFMAGFSARMLSLGSIVVTLLGLPIYAVVKRYYASRKDIRAQ